MNMQTVQELIKNASQLDELMTESEKNKITIHALVKIGDEYTRNVYLTLLMSTVALIEKTESNDNPCSYICRIATALQEKPDMQEILRRSLIIDEKTLKDYAKTLQQNDLQNLFLFDAISIFKIYDKDNATLKDYISGVAEIFAINSNSLEEIYFIAEMIMNRTDGVTKKFLHTDTMKFLPYLQKRCKNIFIESPDIFFMDYNGERDVSDVLQHPLNLENKKLVHFQNIYLHDKKFSFNVKNCQTAEFLNCRFERLTEETVKAIQEFGNVSSFPEEIRLMSFEKIETVKIQNCQFVGMISNLIDYRDSVRSYGLGDYESRGILIFVADIKQLIVHNSIFKDCFFREISVAIPMFMSIGRDGSCMFPKDIFKPGNFTMEEYMKRAHVDFDRDILVAGYNVDSDDVENVTTENSFHF